MKALRSFLLFAVVLLAAGGAAYASGVLSAGMGMPGGTFFWSTPVVVDTQVSATPVYLQCIVMSMSDSAPQAGTITIYDSTAESGTVIFANTFTTSTFMPVQICPQMQTTIGLYIGYSATVDVNTSVSYRK